MHIINRETALVGVETLTPHPRNVNQGNIGLIGESIGQNGFYGSLVVQQSTGHILRGNHTWQAARQAGATEIPVTYVDVDDETALRILLVDNRATREGVDDSNALAVLLQELAGTPAALQGTGYDGDALDELLADLGQGQPGLHGDPDAVPEVPDEPISRRGDLWVLGDHRLLCGDSTDAADVERVMAGERAILFATDPPYLVGYNGLGHPSKWGDPDKNKDWSDTYGVRWDESTQADGSLYRAFCRMALAHAVREDAAWYCWHGFRRQALLEAVWLECGVLLHQQIIWRKNAPILSRVWYMWQHESCFFGWLQGHKPPRVADTYPRSVWDVDTQHPPGERTEHPTAKPVELFALPMLQHTRAGDVCYEPFCGSGSQIIAAEQGGRRCYALEIEPRYVDVAVHRWENLTGKKAEREQVADDARVLSRA